MQLTVVMDNMVPFGASKPFVGEHGYSLLIETAAKRVLLDAGQSEAVVRNLSLLGVHPDELDAIVISHGHFDHAGGLVSVLQHRSRPVAVYGHSGLFTKRYSVSGNKRRYIGIPNTQEELSGLGAKWHLSEEAGEVLPGLMFSGTVPRRTAYEQGDSKLVVCGGCGGDCQDSIADDTSLYYRNKKGLVVLSGCAHAGLVNTVEHGFAVTGTETLLGWVGGTHLGPVGAEQQMKTLEQIEAYAPQFIAASHCTGFAMMSELSRRLGERFVSGMVGQVIEVPE